MEDMRQDTSGNLPTYQPDMKPLLAGRYRMVRQLGRGGMGSVWLAEDTKLNGRRVAVKMLPSVLVSNKRAYAQVKQEALVSLKLTHPNIVTVRAFEEDCGNPFLVMDYIDGRSLDDLLAERGQLSEEDAVKLLRPVADALDYAHKAGVVHRDVKPGNVMVAKDGTPYVLDFGIAREIQETMTKVTGKTVSGTLMYMSPEQLRGAAPKPTQDVYSFAAMSYECLTGHPPFCRGDIVYQILHKPPASLPPSIGIGGQIVAALAKTEDGRPATCRAVLETGTAAKPPRLPSQLAVSERKATARNILIAAALMLAVGFGYLMRSSPTKTESPCLASAVAAGRHATDNDKLVKEAMAAFEARKWNVGYALAMKTDCKDASIQNYLGSCYNCGRGVEKDERAAAAWYRKAAEQGNKWAQFNLGLHYANGRGVEKDEREAV